MITVRERWSPARDVMALTRAMDRMLEERLGRLSGLEEFEGERVITPPADAWEDDDAVVIELALPGADPSQVEVSYEKDLLMVTGRIEPRDEDKQWVLRERARGPFQRQFTLRTPVEPDQAEAHFVNGVLSLKLPKSEAVKPRKIAIQAE